MVTDRNAGGTNEGSHRVHIDDDPHLERRALSVPRLGRLAPNFNVRLIRRFRKSEVLLEGLISISRRFCWQTSLALDIEHGKFDSPNWDRIIEL